MGLDVQALAVLVLTLLFSGTGFLASLWAGRHKEKSLQLDREKFTSEAKLAAEDAAVAQFKMLAEAYRADSDALRDRLHTMDKAIYQLRCELDVTRKDLEKTRVALRAAESRNEDMVIKVARIEQRERGILQERDAMRKTLAKLEGRTGNHL